MYMFCSPLHKYWRTPNVIISWACKSDFGNVRTADGSRYDLILDAQKWFSAAKMDNFGFREASGKEAILSGFSSSCTPNGHEPVLSRHPHVREECSSYLLDTSNLRGWVRTYENIEWWGLKAGCLMGGSMCLVCPPKWSIWAVVWGYSLLVEPMQHRLGF